MILAFSTSSPWASVAALERGGSVLWSDVRHAPRGASEACMAMLKAMREAKDLGPEDAEAFAADIGPGSFTGVRVGVVLAKTYGFVYGRNVMGADSFDLIDPLGVVVLPSKRGEFFVRAPGEPPVRTVELPESSYRGFGEGLPNPEPPTAAGFSRLVDRLSEEDPIRFAPRYLIEPSISIPKKLSGGARG